MLASIGAGRRSVWAAPIVLALIAALGLGYLAIAKPHRKVAAPVG